MQVKPEKAQEVQDTVGAGDAFTSVLLLGLLRSWPLQDTLKRAQKFASDVVGIQGARVRTAIFINNIFNPGRSPLCTNRSHILCSTGSSTI